jgi:hypothetical protein
VRSGDRRQDRWCDLRRALRQVPRPAPRHPRGSGAVSRGPEGVDDNPSLRQLGVLLVAQEERWLAVAGEGSGPSYEDADVADLQRRHGIAGARFRSLVGRLIEEGRLDDVVLDTLCDPPQEYTFGGIIAHVLNFAAHRRSLALGALASAGVTDLGNGDPRTWVAA